MHTPPQKKVFIADLTTGETVIDIFVLEKAQQFQAKNGPYWRIDFLDATGTIEGKIWSPLSQEFTSFTPGAFYHLTGRVSTYREKLELAITDIYLLDDVATQSLHTADFLPASTYSTDVMFSALTTLCSSVVKNPELHTFFSLLFADTEFVAKLAKAPAAKAMHHAYSGGLLEHTLSVCQLCMKLADQYPNVDREILLAGAMCHDLGKIWELSLGFAVDYTDEGRLLGHIIIGLEKLQPYLDASGLDAQFVQHVKHLILSHHGSLEFGSPKLPATAEAFLLHYADNIDAKMQQISTALEPLGDEPTGWSNYIYGLERYLYRAPKVQQETRNDSDAKVANTAQNNKNDTEIERAKNFETETNMDNTESRRISSLEITPVVTHADIPPITPTNTHAVEETVNSVSLPSSSFTDERYDDVFFASGDTSESVDAYDESFFDAFDPTDPTREGVHLSDEEYLQFTQSLSTDVEWGEQVDTDATLAGNKVGEVPTSEMSIHKVPAREMPTNEMATSEASTELCKKTDVTDESSTKATISLEITSPTLSEAGYSSTQDDAFTNTESVGKKTNGEESAFQESPCQDKEISVQESTPASNSPATNSSVAKASSSNPLPLLEQCSLLLKE